MKSFIIFLILIFQVLLQGGETIKFEKKRLDNLNNEACAFGDFTNNGKLDIACAGAWFEYPNWTKHALPDNPNDDFMASMDVDGDGYWDIIRGAFGNNGWYQNNKDGTFSARKVINFGGVHSGGLWDIDGDGKKRELVSANANETIRWAEYVNGNWVTHVVSNSTSNWGSGAGDVNGDGRPDIVRPDAWFEAPANPRSGNWTRHEIAIGALEDKPIKSVKNIKVDHPVWEWNNEKGMFGHTAQIYVYDVDGDGLNDLISSSGHRMGIMWDKQIKNGNNISFERHIIDGSVSEVHSLELEDMDLDGDLDVIASKRWRGHGAYEDPMSEAPLFVSWYEHIQEYPYWKRHWITYGEGISSGTKLGIGDFDGDKDLDVVCIAKNREGRGGGPWLFENKYPETVPEPDSWAQDGEWKAFKLGDESNVTVAFADIDKDGNMDLVGGNFWYKGPAWQPQRFRSLTADGMSEMLDVDGDGWLDVISGSYGQGLSWYRNPQGASGNWNRTVIDNEGNYENGQLWDVDGDGKAEEIVTSSYIAGVKWWEVVNGNWVSHTISNMQCNFGAGVGDVNKDGRPDIIRPNAWFEAPVNPRSGNWTAHPIALGANDDSETAPGADMTAPMWLGRVQLANGRNFTHGHTGQIYVYDVDDDGKNDLIASSAHRSGIYWYKQIDSDNFERRTVDGSWTQAHGLEFKDMDNDGDPDLVTGKAKNAQPSDPQVNNPLQVTWYELIPGAAVPWVRHDISYGKGIGAGYNLGIEDFDKDGDMDVAVTGSNGGPWILSNPRITSIQSQKFVQPKINSKLFTQRNQVMVGPHNHDHHDLRRINGALINHSAGNKMPSNYKIHHGDK